MRLSIAYAKNFRHNLSSYIEEQQAIENEKRQRQRLIDEQRAIREAEEKRKDLYLDIEPDPPFVSKHPFTFKRPEKSFKTHPDLSSEIQRTESEIEAKKNNLYIILNPEQSSISSVQTQLNELESKIRAQDVRRPRN